MKTLILYGSKYGCTEDCVKYLNNKLNQQADTASLKNPGRLDFDQYDWILAGGSIYVGKIQKEVKRFCEQNLEMMLNKNIALFLCCTTPEQAGFFFKSNFPDRLLKHAVETVNFGGELRRDKMGFFDKGLTAMVSKLEPKKEEILYKNIDQLAVSINT